MKKLWLVLLLMGSLIHLSAQQRLPSADIETINRIPINTDEIKIKSTSIVVMWATWDATAKKLLGLLARDSAVFREKNVKIICISIDDERIVDKVAQYWTYKGYPFDIYLDPQASFRRRIQKLLKSPISSPGVLLVDRKRKIQWSSYGYHGEDDLKKLHEKVDEVNLKN